MVRVTVKSRQSIPVEPGERFSVKDGNGKVVEVWEHHHTKDGYHHYDVSGYSNSN